MNYLNLSKPGLQKLIIRSGFIVLLLSINRSLFGQMAGAETKSDLYSNVIVIVLILLIASIFIGLEILNDPKNETQNSIQNSIQIDKSITPSESILLPGYEFDKSLASELKIVFYSAGLLVLLYAVLVIMIF